jgi:hypothetical protein
MNPNWIAFNGCALTLRLTLLDTSLVMASKWCVVVAAPALVGSTIESRLSVDARVSTFLSSENATSVSFQSMPLDLHALTSDASLLDSWAQPLNRFNYDRKTTPSDSSQVDAIEAQRLTIVRFITYMAPVCRATMPPPGNDSFVPVASASSAENSPGSNSAIRGASPPGYLWPIICVMLLLEMGSLLGNQINDTLGSIHFIIQVMSRFASNVSSLLQIFSKTIPLALLAIVLTSQ